MRKPFLAFFSALILTALFMTCTRTGEIPDTESEEYRQAVSSFYIGLAAMQSDEALFAVEKMNEVAERYQREPAAWANLGVFAMRQGDFELAGERLSKAESLAPENADIQFLYGILESRRGEIDASIRHLEKAARLAPENPQILYALVSELERQNVGENKSLIEEQLNTLMQLQPDNLAVMLEMARLAVKLENRQLLEQALNELRDVSGDWPEEVKTQFDGLRENILAKPVEELNFEIAFLRNNLTQLPDFEKDFDEIEIPPDQVGFLIDYFLWLPEPENGIEPPDLGLSFEREELNNAGKGLSMIVFSSLAGDSIPDLVSLAPSRATINNRHKLAVPGQTGTNLNPNAVVTFDYNYDFLNDLLFLGGEGFIFYEQQADSTFREATGQIGLADEVINRAYTRGWSRDLDLDGDLDLLLSSPGSSPVYLRNNGDETFTEMTLFEESGTPIDFVWADFDADGDPDAALLDEFGHIDLYQNQRSGEFKPVSSIKGLGRFSSLAVADLDRDTRFEILALNQTAVHMVDFDGDAGTWNVRKIITRADSSSDAEAYSELFVADFDNNGGMDLLVSTPASSRLWLGGNGDNFQPLDQTLPGNITSFADADGDFRLDLLGVSEERTPFQLVARGSEDYHARVIRPRASGPLGDRRINSFGIGGEIEIRSGVLYKKQLIQDPLVHVGLGSYEEAEMLRIIWPNGSVQAEFAELGYGSKIFNEQILKGSCPWIFAYNGSGMGFVTDFLWRSPVGLKINAQETAGVVQTYDRVKIDGTQLKPKNGLYDVRITAELWETHFFDYVSLLAIDHPAGTEIFIDERFSIPPPDLDIKVTGKPQEVAGAIDRFGNDVTNLINEKDQQYFDHFQRTRYQGVTEEYYIEIDIGHRAPVNEPLWLLAHGWVKPTDSSINVALSQGDNDFPRGIRVEVSDGKGGWKIIEEDIGFPAGKNKTILVDLENKFPDNNDRRIRLYTSTETYWDMIKWARGLPGAEVEIHYPEPVKMQLRYRGYSTVTQEHQSAPELPNYEEISGTTQKWRDLAGYYTRFGDVSELLSEIDDRYVIMNAGDELLFRNAGDELLFSFGVVSEPTKNYERDFVLAGDGWVKDGDYNTGYSKTVQPLPYHGMSDYSDLPIRLTEDPVYQKHREDWIHYHTRYIDTGRFQSAMQLDNDR